ncbi:MAG: SMP-30/gluconolactonase/LRE family protein [Rhizobiaceae bacterium]|nr:SMP-30/gluconolactonase/LRE family protein [Rhizobiaceae bacterium]
MKRIAIVALLALLGAPALADGPLVINDKAAFPEGPVFVDGKLHYVEYGANTILVWDGAKTTKLWEQAGCGPSAVMPLGDDLVVTCYDNGTIARVSKDGKTVATYDKAADGGTLQGPNDFTADGKGGAFFTTSGPWESGPIVGKVFHLSADGTIKEEANDLHYANGVALSVDGKRLYVNESEAGRVISFAVGEDFSLSDRRLFVRVAAVDEASGAAAYPDGIKLGPDGNLWIGQYSKGRIVVVNPDGAFVKAIDVPSATAPNLAFAPDGKAIYVMSVDDTANAPYWGKVYEVPLE